MNLNNQNSLVNIVEKINENKYKAKIKTGEQEIINKNSGKVLKIEKWGLLNFKRKIKNYTKGYFLHFKLKGDNKTLDEIKEKQLGG